ncbi:MAG: MarP family serine protease [Acidimicrobiales bacterium]
MTWVDVVILVLVALAAVRGSLGGLARQVGQLAGLVGGLLAGADVAAGLSGHVTTGHLRPLVALGLVVVIMLVGASLGAWLGSLVHRALQMARLGLLDRIGGAVVGGAGMLIVLWLIAGLLAPVAWGSVSSAIQGSLVLRAVDTVAPPVPAVEARVQAILRSADLPNVFAALIAPSTPTPTIHLGPPRANVADPASVLKVLATQGCPIGHEGTAFVVGPHEVVTDAHVVAGAHDIRVGTARGTVVLFNPRDDLAVIHVGGPLPAPLTLATSAPPSHVPAAVVGYPLDATRTLSPAELLGTVRASSRDIYDRTVLERTLLVVASRIEPGNSGSPVLRHGGVVGIVDSRSLSNPLIGYATPIALVRQAIAQVTSDRAVSTQGCVG